MSPRISYIIWITQIKFKTINNAMLIYDTLIDLDSEELNKLKDIES